MGNMNIFLATLKCFIHEFVKTFRVVEVIFNNLLAQVFNFSL